MSIVDKELPFALIDLIISVVQCFMGGVFMCMVSGYFALTLPPVLLVVWGKPPHPFTSKTTDSGKI